VKGTNGAKLWAILGEPGPSFGSHIHRELPRLGLKVLLKLVWILAVFYFSWRGYIMEWKLGIGTKLWWTAGLFPQNGGRTLLTGWTASPGRSYTRPSDPESEGMCGYSLVFFPNLKGHHSLNHIKFV
jgi:hypothetical protein